MAGVRVEGLNRYLRDLKKFGASIDDLKDIMYGIGQHVADEAKTLAPVRTGALQDSIRASKAQRTAVIRAGSAKVPYSSFVEWGTAVMEGQEPVTTAIENNQQYAASELDQGLEALARRYGLN